MIGEKGQVWIETVLYTIVGLAIIGVVLAFVMPQINESKDNVIIEQSINSFKELDGKLRDVARQQGDVGIVELNMKRGSLYINTTGNELLLTIEGLSSLYSEPGVSINDGNINITTIEGQKKNTVILLISYPFNITYNNADIDKKLTAAPLAYRLYIENKGNNKIDITTN